MSFKNDVSECLILGLGILIMFPIYWIYLAGVYVGVFPDILKDDKPTYSVVESENSYSENSYSEEPKVNDSKPPEPKINDSYSKAEKKQIEQNLQVAYILIRKNIEAYESFGKKMTVAEVSDKVEDLNSFVIRSKNYIANNNIDDDRISHVVYRTEWAVYNMDQVLEYCSEGDTDSFREVIQSLMDEICNTIEQSKKAYNNYYEEYYE